MMNESAINEGMREIDDIGVASRIHMVHHAKGETPSLGMELGILRRGNQQTRLRLFGSMQVRCLPNREELCLKHVS